MIALVAVAAHKSEYRDQIFAPFLVVAGFVLVNGKWLMDRVHDIIVGNSGSSSKYYRTHPPRRTFRAPSNQTEGTDGEDDDIEAKKTVKDFLDDDESEDEVEEEVNLLG